MAGHLKSPPPLTLNERARGTYLRLLTKQEAFFQRVGVDDSLIYDPRPGSGVDQGNRATKLWTWGASDLRTRFGVQGILWMWTPKPPPSAAGQQ